MTGRSTLPGAFVALEPFVDDWAVTGCDARIRRRIASEPASRLEFYEAACPLLPAALEHLDAKGFNGLDESDVRLLDLLLTLAHVALAVEQQGDVEPVHARAHARFRIERSSEDFDGHRAFPAFTC